MPLPDPITSAGNAEVKRLKSLHERKFRRQTGWFLAEGMRICTGRWRLAGGCTVWLFSTGAAMTAWCARFLRRWRVMAGVPCR